MHIFRTNEFFNGITLPQPETMEPLETKLPRQAIADEAVLDFLKVTPRKITIYD